MACEHVRLPDGTCAIVCGRVQRQRCYACGLPADRQCDWRVKSRRSGTCDKHICAACSTSPAPDKDICPDHAPALASWLNARASTPPSTESCHV